MYYLVTVKYTVITEDGKGREKIQKVKHIVEGDSVEEIALVMANYHKGDTGYDSIDSVKQFPLDEIITRDNNPNFYKN
jgi:hypothetical protein